MKAGASEAEAGQAARIDAADLATKADLIKLQADLQKVIQAMLSMTAIFAFIVGLFRVFA